MKLEYHSASDNTAAIIPEAWDAIESIQARYPQNRAMP